MADKSRNLVFDDLVTRLIGLFSQSLPQHIARAAIQDAWRTICGERDWFFLRRKGLVILPGAMTEASGTFTADDNLVVVNTATKTYLDAIRFSLVGTMGLLAPDGRWYQILRWYTSSSTLVISKPYLGTTETDTFKIACAIVPPPLVSVYQEFGADTPASGGSMRPDHTFNGFVKIYRTGGQKTRLNFSLQSITMSPEHRFTTNPTCLYPYVAGGEQYGYYDATSSGGLKSDSPMFQIYPTYDGTETIIYEALYRSTGGEFSDDTTEGVKSLPTVIPTEMLIAQAAMKVGIWAASNLKAENKVSYLQIAASYQGVYQAQLERAILHDDNILSKDKLGNPDEGYVGLGELILLDDRQVIVT